MWLMSWISTEKAAGKKKKKVSWSIFRERTKANAWEKLNVPPRLVGGLQAQSSCLRRSSVHCHTSLANRKDHAIKEYQLLGNSLGFPLPDTWTVHVHPLLLSVMGQNLSTRLPGYKTTLSTHWKCSVPISKTNFILLRRKGRGGD